MKKVLRSIHAMALINPDMSKNLTLRVEVEQRDERPIPHVHVYHDRTRNPEKCSYIRLDKAEYSTHHKNNRKLPRNLQDEFVQLMNETWTRYIIKTSSGYRPATGYEAAVYIWADTYEHGKLDKFQTDENGDLISFNYSTID